MAAGASVQRRSEAISTFPSDATNGFSLKSTLRVRPRSNVSISLESAEKPTSRARTRYRPAPHARRVKLPSASVRIPLTITPAVSTNTTEASFATASVSPLTCTKPFTNCADAGVVVATNNDVTQTPVSATRPNQSFFVQSQSRPYSIIRPFCATGQVRKMLSHLRPNVLRLNWSESVESRRAQPKASNPV